MTSETYPRASGAALPGLGTWATVIGHAVASRLVYDGAFVLGRLLEARGPAREVAAPSAATLVDDLVATARNYGDYDWYWSVVLRGYSRIPFEPVAQQNWAFFPLHPLMIRLIPTPQAQFLVALAAFLASVALVFVYLRRVVGLETARAAALLMAWFPFSYSLAEFRPEAFMLFFSALALVLAQRGRFWDGALAAGVAGLAKPNAFLLALLLIPQVWPQRWTDWRAGLRGLRPATIALLAAPASGIVFMSAYLWRATGEPLAWAKIQAAWGAHFGVAPLEQLRGVLTHPMLIGRDGWDPILMHWALLAVALVAIGWLVAARRYVFALYCAAYIGLTFANFGVFVLGKHLSTCFPVFVGLALMVRRRGGLEFALSASAAMLALAGLLGGLGLDVVRA